MNFLYPDFFFLLLIPIIILILSNRFKKNKIFNKSIRKRLISKTFSSSGYLQKTLLFLLFFFIVCSLARPVIMNKDDMQLQTKEESFLSISLDISKSMLSEDITPNRLIFSKKIINEILKNLSHTKVALTSFARDVYLISPFSEDKESVAFLLNNIDYDSLFTQGSSVVSAILGSNKLYDKIKLKTKDLLIITDGADGQEIEEAIREALDKKIRVHLLIIGTKEGSKIPYGYNYVEDSKGEIVISKRMDDIKQLSIDTKGVYLISDGSIDELSWFVKQIENKLEKNLNPYYEKGEQKELFIYAILISLIILFILLYPIYSLKISKNSLFVLACLLSFTHKADASFFDFYSIMKSHENYNGSQHKIALGYFEKVDLEKNSVYTQYNLANSYYRNRKYDMAIKLYKSIKSDDKILNYERLHNLGNAYYKKGDTKNAIKAYKEALKIQDDKATAFNLAYIQKKKDGSSTSGKEKNKKKSKEKAKSNKTDKKNENKKNKMDKSESQKWKEKLGKIKKLKTKPQAFYKNTKGKKNEYHW